MAFGRWVRKGVVNDPLGASDMYKIEVGSQTARWRFFGNNGYLIQDFYIRIYILQLYNRGARAEMEFGGQERGSRPRL